MTLDKRRVYYLTLAEEETGWAFTAMVEAETKFDPVHENKLRAQGMLTVAELLTTEALKLRKDHLNG